MGKKVVKRTPNGSGKEKLLRGIQSVVKAGSSILSPEEDKTARRCRNLRVELNARISRLEKQKLQSPKEITVQEFEQIMEKEAKQKEDRVIWRTYSKYGGIGDVLTDIRKAVERPSSNAFEFDEEEGAYIIFITLNNTCISRMTALCSEMRSECGRTGEMECSELQKKRETLQKTYHELRFKMDKLSPKSFSEQWEKALGVKWGKPEEVLRELKKAEKALDSYEQEIKDYGDNVKAYEEQLAFFIKECEQQRAYVPRYGALFEELTKLEEISKEEHPFHMLTISPEGETELGRYMEMAREFNKWTLHITEEYPV